MQQGMMTGVQDMTDRKPERKPAVPYSDEIGEQICERLSEGESLNAICNSTAMPSERAVRFWAADPDHPFSPKYARA
jgi:hypothetical protein